MLLEQRIKISQSVKKAWKYKTFNIEERNRKISEAHKGKKLSKEHREKLSKSHLGKRCGILSNNWKGGIFLLPNYRKEYAKKYRERGNALRRKYYAENINRYKEYQRKWKTKNREKLLLSKRFYMLKRRTTIGTLTKREMQEVYEDNIKKYKTLTCYLCNKPIEFGQDSIDHIIPVSKGGSNNKSNLAIAHRKCNYGKKDKIIV
jgi:5-methylcytosine-specific restriction endonuclease McrA